MKKKKITTMRPNGQVITAEVGPDHPAYWGEKNNVFLAHGQVEGRGDVVLVQEDRK